MAKNLEISLLLDYYGSLLTDKQRLIAEYYFNDDLSLAEIAELEQVTRQAVRDIVRRVEKQLEGFEDRLHFAHRLYAVGDAVSRLRSQIEAGADKGTATALCDEILKDLMKE